MRVDLERQEQVHIIAWAILTDRHWTGHLSLTVTRDRLDCHPPLK